MKSLLQEYHTKVSDLIEDDGTEQIADLLGEIKEKSESEVPRFTKPPTSRARLVSIRQELKDDLRLSPARVSSKPKAFIQFGVSKPDSRPVSPTSPENQLSPNTLRNNGVYMGFTMSVVLRNLGRIADQLDTESKVLFFTKLRKLTKARLCVMKLFALLERKRLNILFHTFQIMKPEVVEIKAPHVVVEHRSIFPMHSSRRLENIPLLLSLDRPHLGRYAGLGRVVGVLLSVIRLQKLDAIKQLSSSTKFKR